MKQELFNPQSSSVRASRIIYTPSTFARTSLVYLQEVGSFESLSPHVSKRSNLVSFLCFIVLSGRGQLSYEGEVYKLAVGDCVFIDYQKAYSHSTGYLCDVDENCAEKIVLDNLAECFFISKFYMTKIFKEKYGTTIVNYLIFKRITRAKQLLRFTDMTMVTGTNGR